MGLNLETLVGILVILILLIMADGLRRMLRERQDSLRMKIEPRRRDNDDEPRPEHNPELPSGGARVVQRMLAQRAEAEAAEAAAQRSAEREATEDDADAQHETRGASTPPLMMEPEEGRQAPVHRASQQKLFGETAADDDDDEALPPMSARRDEDEQREISAARPASAAPRARPATPSASKAPSARKTEPAPSPAPRNEAARASASTRPPAQPVERKPEPVAEPAPEPRIAPELMEVIVVHLIAQRGERFDGRELLQQLLENGLRFGDMNIFHCHRNENGRDVLQFSMANAVEPGTFDIDTMESERFAGVTFFLKLPGPGRPMGALERMLETVRKLADALHGELKDEQRSVLTPQTMEHLRQRVQEFERRLRVHQGA
ncbi:cell division protein ZipA [Alcanivorax sp. JB21]|uniref:cell division protein ZipA n=1 Tax=Alcanivorax limicola TaxID=2874102 RepID=UPI001CBDD067|nr:cell division protein ZipA [Alcanivorax limicola]MBZ2189920.1 cell division protein ZipA [Alcanivorax limicola]